MHTRCSGWRWCASQPWERSASRSGWESETAPSSSRTRCSRSSQPSQPQDFSASRSWPTTSSPQKADCRCWSPAIWAPQSSWSCGCFWCAWQGSRRNRKAEFTLLREDGSGDPYTRPSGDSSRFIQVPHELWTDGPPGGSSRWFEDLSLPELSFLIIARSNLDFFALPVERGPAHYGISADTLSRGYRALRDKNLLEVQMNTPATSKMSTNAARTRESPATHRPERYRASLPRASAPSTPIIQHININVNPQLLRTALIEPPTLTCERPVGAAERPSRPVGRRADWLMNRHPVGETGSGSNGEENGVRPVSEAAVSGTSRRAADL